MSLFYIVIEQLLLYSNNNYKHKYIAHVEQED